VGSVRSAIGGRRQVIVEYVRYRVDEESWPAFEAAWARAAAVLARAVQCVDHELSRSVDEPACAVVRITWTSAEDHLQGFRGGPLFPEFLAEVRPWVDDIEEMRHYARTPVHGAGGSVPSLYDWAGGLTALERLTTVFYDHVRQDPLVGPLFAHMDGDHPRHVALWLSEVLGGPDRYTRERGGYPAMLGHHLGKGITEAQRRRWVELLLDAADETGLPSDPEFRAAFVGYLEWGTRLAVANSRPGADVVRSAPVPRWGWGVAPPWVG
jgi:hemoglobin